jgi:hypothetical protein
MENFDWVELKKHPEYEIAITPHGYIFRRKDGSDKPFTPFPSGVRLEKDIWCPLARLVAEQFLPNPNNYPCVNLRNRNLDDCRLENLRWANRKMISGNAKLPNRVFLNELPEGFQPFTQYQTTGRLYEFADLFIKWDGETPHFITFNSKLRYRIIEPSIGKGTERKGKRTEYIYINYRDINGKPCAIRYDKLLPN